MSAINLTMFWLRWGIAQCFFSVVLGAFAAHGLKNTLSQYYLDIFQTAVKYQFFHGLALMILAILIQVYGIKLNLVALGFALGSLIFSGSLYVLSLSGIKAFGAVTPIGGVILLVCWAGLFYKSFYFRTK